MSSKNDEEVMVDMQYGLSASGLKNEFAVVIHKQPPSHQPMRYSSEAKKASQNVSQRMSTTAPLIPEGDAWMEMKLKCAEGIPVIPKHIEVTISTCNLQAPGGADQTQLLPHPFQLTGPGTDNGVYQRQHSGHQTISIPSLRIVRCKKEDIQKNLTEKIPYDPSGQLDQSLKKSDKSQLKISTEGLRLCISLKLIFPDNSSLQLDPLYSDPIMNASTRKNIVLGEIQPCSSPCNKSTEVYMWGHNFQKGDVIIFSEKATGWCVEVPSDMDDGMKKMTIFTPVYNGPSKSEKVDVVVFVRRQISSRCLESNEVPFTFYKDYSKIRGHPLSSQTPLTLSGQHGQQYSVPDEYCILTKRARKELKCGTGNNTFSVQTKTEALNATDGGTGSDFICLNGSNDTIISTTQVNGGSGQDIQTPPRKGPTVQAPGNLRCNLYSAVDSSSFQCIHGNPSGKEKQQGIKRPFSEVSKNSSDTEKISTRSDLPFEKYIGENMTHHSMDDHHLQNLQESKTGDGLSPNDINLSTSSAHIQHVTLLGDVKEDFAQRDSGGTELAQWMDFELEKGTEKVNTDQGASNYPPVQGPIHEDLRGFDLQSTLVSRDHKFTDQSNFSTDVTNRFSDLNELQIPPDTCRPIDEESSHVTSFLAELQKVPENLMNLLSAILDAAGYTQQAESASDVANPRAEQIAECLELGPVTNEMPEDFMEP